MLTIINIQFISINEILYYGMFIAIFLIINLSIKEIFIESKIWNKWALNCLNICNITLFIVFLLIIIFKILIIV